jgi:AGZA family xanthine/uracil permease-like MFS transporter
MSNKNESMPSTLQNPLLKQAVVNGELQQPDPVSSNDDKFESNDPLPTRTVTFEASEQDDVPPNGRHMEVSVADTVENFEGSNSHNLKSLVHAEFYSAENWFWEMCNILFKLRRRKTTIKSEIWYGFIHFISCFYCLAVIPQQLSNAGYSSRPTIVSVALCSGFGSIFSGLFANLPFVLAPPTVISIFLSVYLQQYNEGPAEGNIAVIISGFILIFFGWKPLGKFVARLIPISIQVGTAIGIGLLTALAGSTEIDLVETGTYTILEMGNITAEIVIAFAGVIFICIAMRYHVKGAFCIAVLTCSLIWWIYDNDWPDGIASFTRVKTFQTTGINGKVVPLLTLDLVFLYILYLNGLMTSLSNLAVLTREDSSVPRGRWIYIMSGGFSILSGFLSSAPILVSPESASSIKEGAKTGLSAVIAGILFLLSAFFSPILEKIPSAGTSPILIMIGIILLQNVNRIDWRNLEMSAPAFVVLFYIPFTYSILQGLLLFFSCFSLSFCFIIILAFPLFHSFLYFLVVWSPYFFALSRCVARLYRISNHCIIYRRIGLKLC